MRRSSVLGRSGKLQHLVDSIFECHQISRHEFTTGAGEFVILNNGIEFAATYFIMLLALFFIGYAGHSLGAGLVIDDDLIGSPSGAAGDDQGNVDEATAGIVASADRRESRNSAAATRAMPRVQSSRDPIRSDNMPDTGAKKKRNTKGIIMVTPTRFMENAKGCTM